MPKVSSERHILETAFPSRDGNRQEQFGTRIVLRVGFTKRFWVYNLRHGRECESAAYWTLHEAVHDAAQRRQDWCDGNLD